MYFDKHDPEVEELILSCMESSMVFDKTLFPEEVESDFSILHKTTGLRGYSIHPARSQESVMYYL